MIFGYTAAEYILTIFVLNNKKKYTKTIPLMESDYHSETALWACYPATSGERA
jgi:hypothetical protein